MGKATNFLWKLFRKATNAAEAKEKEPAKIKVQRKLTKIAYHKTTIRLPADLVKAYKHAAVERNIPYSQLVEEALDYYLREVLRRRR
jgi:predicted DNA binding CopG/RHH family protein